MILVTVGTHEQPFDRLLKKVDDLIETGKIKEKVIGQIGYSDYKPKNFDHFRFVGFEKMSKLFDSANLIITHGGIGSIFLAIRKGKRIIAVPRMKKFREHSDDHQIQVVKELERQKRLVAVYEMNDLEEAISKIRSFPFKKKYQPNVAIINRINSAISEWEKSS